MVLQQAFGYKRCMLKVIKVNLKENILFLQHFGVIRFVVPFIRAGLTQLDILTLLFLQHLGVIRFVVPFIRAGLTQLDILTWKAQ